MSAPVKGLVLGWLYGVDGECVFVLVPPGLRSYNTDETWCEFVLSLALSSSTFGQFRWGEAWRPRLLFAAEPVRAPASFVSPLEGDESEITGFWDFVEGVAWPPGRRPHEDGDWGAEELAEELAEGMDRSDFVRAVKLLSELVEKAPGEVPEWLGPAETGPTFRDRLAALLKEKRAQIRRGDETRG